MNRPRILHLRASNFVGGPEKQLLRHAESERDGPWEILLGTFVSSREGADFLQAIESRGLGAVSLPADILVSSLRALIRVVRVERIGLLCTHGYKADILGLLASRIADIPLACFLRGWTGENWKVRLYERADRFGLHFADCVVCLSESRARKLSADPGLREKLRIVNNAIDLPAASLESRVRARSELRQRFGLPEESVVVAAGGRLSPEKGIKDFLLAISRLQSQFPDVRFLIFGDGFLRRRLERDARSYGIQDRVIFAGFHRDLARLLPGLDLLVNPSLSEEMPNIVLEGMAAEIPIIATAVGGVEDLAGPQGALRLVPTENPGTLANAIGELLRNPARAKELALAGRRRVGEAFSPALQQSQLHALYEELVSASQLESRRAAKRVEDSVASNQARLDVQHPSREQLPILSGRARLLPQISVVIPVRNEGANIGAVLQDLLRQNYPADRFEIIVVDGNSTDETREVVEEFQKRSITKILLLANPVQVSSAGRNMGVRASHGDLIIFVDGHCHIASCNLLQDAAELFEFTGADCLCRPQPLTMPGNTRFQDAVAHVRGSSLGHGRDSTIYSTGFEGVVNPSSAGALYRREVFERVGYFDERFDACEDVEFNYRIFKAGLRSYFSPRLTIFYRPRSGLRELFQQMMRYGRGRQRLIRKHASAFSISQAVPAVFLLWVIVGGIFSFFSLRIAQVFLTTLAVYATVVLSFAASLGPRYGWRHLLLAPAIYLSIHIGLGAGFLAEGIWPTRRSSMSANCDSGATFCPAARATPNDSVKALRGDSSATSLSGKG